MKLDKLLFVKANKERLKAVLTIRAKVLEYTREWLNREHFIEVQGPVLFPVFGKENRHFIVNYFDKKAYLSAGLAPYSDAFLDLFDKIYTIAPSFRAEPITSKRHLTEYWHIEILSKSTFESLLSIEQSLLVHIFFSLAKNCPDQLTELGSPLVNASQLRIPFPRITYDRAIEKLKEAGFSVFWGETITRDMEIALTRLFDQPFFLINFPLSIETLLYKSILTEPLLTFSADLLAPQGFGEIAACNELVVDKKIIEERLTEAEIGTEDKNWYLNIKQSNISPQSMASIGIERLLQWICAIDDIKDTTLIPRQFGLPLF